MILFDFQKGLVKWSQTSKDASSQMIMTDHKSRDICLEKLDRWVNRYDNQEQWSRIRPKVSIMMDFWIEALALNHS